MAEEQQPASGEDHDRPALEATGTPPGSSVRVIDHDPSVCEALAEFLSSVGYRLRGYTSVEAFLDDYDPEEPGCLILEVRTPGHNGLDVQRQLAERGVALPVIFLTAHGEIRMAVRAMRTGAIDFLTKPYDEQEMLDAVDLARASDRGRRASLAERAEMRDRFALLSIRELEVLTRASTGMRNSRIAEELGISEITVKMHRSAGQRKIGATTLLERVRALDLIRVL